MQKPTDKNDVPDTPNSGSDRQKSSSIWRPGPNRRACIALIIATALLYGAGLGQTDFWAPDEPRYGAIAEEIRSARHGPTGWVLLHLNGIPYTQKPPLYFWIAATLGIPFERVHESLARLPSAAAGVVCVGLTVWIGMLLFRRRLPAILAAGLLATSFRFAFTARRAQLDVLLTAFELAAIALFLYLEFRRGGIQEARRSPLTVAGIHLALGAAALTKGPVGWLPLLVFVAYLAWEGRLGAIRAITPAWAWTLSLGPLAVWITAAITLAPPGFAEVAVGENLVGRFFSGTSHARPIYYFARQLPLDFLPWSLLLPFGIPILWRASQTNEDDSDVTGGSHSKSSAVFLLAWTMVPLLFFSLSAGKRGVYLLPIFPALALVCVLAGSRIGAIGQLARPMIHKFKVALVVVGLIELASFTLILPRFESEKSPRAIAEAATRVSRSGERIGVFAMRPIEGGIAYYGDRPIASLRDEAELRTFLDGGGRVVILRDRHLDQFGDALGLRVIQKFRRGERRLAVAERIPRRESRSFEVSGFSNDGLGSIGIHHPYIVGCGSLSSPMPCRGRPDFANLTSVHIR